MKKMMTNPIQNIAQMRKSHAKGWAMSWSELLDAEINHGCDTGINNAEILYIEHGVNFAGSLNMFGGATDEVIRRINAVAVHPNVVSLDHNMPNYGEILRKRINAKTTSHLVTQDWCDAISKFCKGVPSYSMVDKAWAAAKDVIIGDSHSIAFSRKDEAIFRNDGMTLRKAIGTPVAELLRGYEPEPGKSVTLCFGSIDIRHHLLRPGAEKIDWVGYKKLITELVDLGLDVYACAPVPVEYEGRKIPKTGMYKGTGFYGSQADRASLTQEIIGEIEYIVGPRQLIQPPHEWYTMCPEAYAKEKMEMSGSVHIAPPNYNRNHWGEV